MTIAPTADPPAATDLPPAAERGRLTIAPAVVRGIVEAAASEVDGVVAQRRGLGFTSRAARAIALLDGTSATVRVRLSLRYPQSIPDAVARLRAHIVDRVDSLAGITVDACDIDIIGLVNSRVTEAPEQGIG